MEGGRKRKRQEQQLLLDEWGKETSLRYDGFVLSDSNATSSTIDRVDAASLTPKAFFEKYVAKRKPCILFHGAPDATTDSGSKTKGNANGAPLVPSLVDRLTPNLLEQVAGSLKVQVERRESTASFFGQNRTAQRQVDMTLGDFLLVGSDSANSNQEASANCELFYLSTQQHSDSDGDEHAREQSAESRFLGPTEPLRRQGYLPETLPAAGKLVLESCNLWMGRMNGTPCESKTYRSLWCSGLHHDFHDNFYILVNGSKDFLLYPPTEYPYMGTYGTVKGMHRVNGLISYEQEPTRTDGVPCATLEILANRQGDEEKDDGIDDDGEEHVVIGKGFDYATSGSDASVGEQSGVCNEKDDYEALVLAPEEKPKPGSLEGTSSAKRSRPISFSRIDPTKPRKNLEREHPDFVSRVGCTVRVRAGESLYLPASWFHCVTSHAQGKVDGNFHLAVNYWYHPPDRLDNFESPYQDESFWKLENESS